jgi:hypothetical protein
MEQQDGTSGWCSIVDFCELIPGEEEPSRLQFIKIETVRDLERFFLKFFVDRVLFAIELNCPCVVVSGCELR